MCKSLKIIFHTKPKQWLVNERTAKKEDAVGFWNGREHKDNDDEIIFNFREARQKKDARLL